MPATLAAPVGQQPGPHGHAPPSPHGVSTASLPSGTGRRRGLLIAVALGVVVLLAAAVLLVNRTPSSPTASEPTPPSAPGAGPTSTQNLTFTGAADGALSDAAVQCPTDGANAWSITGQLDGRKLEVFVTFSQGDPGVGNHPLDTGLTPGHGIVTATLGDGSYVTDAGGANGGTFTVDPEARTGSLEAELGSPGGGLHVSGSWSCTSA